VVFKAAGEVLVDLTKDDDKDKAVIRYVPTPDDITAEMIKLAKISKEDIVFEPGCGDSRITIAAVKAGAKRGVGVDLDPERITESKANIKAAKLEDKIDVRLGDALDIKDFDQATVVFLYMGNEFNMLIRPVLWKQLKVGTRIVSHRFTMGDWKPEKTITITGQDGDEYELHLWTITEEVKKKAKGQ
jgi:precorrin-6B methylase 2